MTSSENQAPAPADDGFTQTWRYKIGLAMIVVGNLGIVFAVLVMPALGASAGTVGTFVVGGEVLSLASIVFLGKAGFKAIKAKFLGWIKSSYEGPVSRNRHYIGIALFCTAVLANLIIGLFDVYSIDWDTSVPKKEVWGLGYEAQVKVVGWLYLIGIIGFLSSIYTLGGDWWEKFRRLFVWEKAAE